jgi:hypothetical protein
VTFIAFSLSMSDHAEEIMLSIATFVLLIIVSPRAIFVFLNAVLKPLESALVSAIAASNSAQVPYEGRMSQ